MAAANCFRRMGSARTSLHVSPSSGVGSEIPTVSAVPAAAVPFVLRLRFAAGAAGAAPPLAAAASSYPPEAEAGSSAVESSTMRQTFPR